jgi:peroxiredoxin
MNALYKNKLLKHLPLIFALLIVVSCNKTPGEAGEDSKIKKYKVSGKLQNASNDSLLLRRIDGQKIITVDSTVLNDKGEFELSVNAAEPDFYILHLNDSVSRVIILDEQHIKLTADASDIINTFAISGKGNNDYISFNKKVKPFLDKEAGIKSRIPQLIERNNLDSLSLLKKDMERSQEDIRNFVRHYIDSIIPSLAIFNVIGYLNIEKDFDYLVALSKTLEKKLPDSKFTKLLSKEISKMLAMQQKSKDGGITVGMKAPEISLPDPRGKIIKLSSLRGKYVLLDFWASWCGPCRAENPNVVKVYNKFKSKNFDIFSISLDKDKSAWLEAIQKDGLAWTHVSDLQLWDSAVVPLYALEGIPATFLLDKEGTVIAKNLRGKELEEKLEEVFK